VTKRSDNVQKILVRLPGDVKRWLEDTCAHNLTSYSSEVTMTLRARMDAESEKVAG
jgi:hypothetical protein